MDDAGNGKMLSTMEAMLAALQRIEGHLEFLAGFEDRMIKRQSDLYRQMDDMTRRSFVRPPKI
jgi:hypothetical protein